MLVFIGAPTPAPSAAACQATTTIGPGAYSSYNVSVEAPFQQTSVTNICPGDSASHLILVLVCAHTRFLQARAHACLAPLWALGEHVYECAAVQHCFQWTPAGCPDADNDGFLLRHKELAQPSCDHQKAEYLLCPPGGTWVGSIETNFVKEIPLWMGSFMAYYKTTMIMLGCYNAAGLQQSLNFYAAADAHWDNANYDWDAQSVLTYPTTGFTSIQLA